MPTDSSYRAARRSALSQHPQQIGLDYVEVAPNAGAADAIEWQLTLHFVPGASSEKRSTPLKLLADNIQIADPSGAPTSDVRVVTSKVPDPGDLSDMVTVTLRVETSAGHVSARPPGYLLSLVSMPEVDPFFAEAGFVLGTTSSEYDPRPSAIAAAPPPTEAAISYLARDYASFRQLMLDRLSLLMPDWSERHAADGGVALVEVLAYAADHLSYYQDAVATEAYLGTARKRVSVRRHARLLDYAMHEGCNARAWVHVEVSAEHVTLRAGTELLTRLQAPGVITPSDAARLLGQAPQVFATMHAAELRAAHNTLSFYTWGAAEAVLPAGTTCATLCDAWLDEQQSGRKLQLRPGDVLIFEQVRDPHSGAMIDAEAEQCQAVRLVDVRKAKDALGGLLLGQGDTTPVPVVDITWAAADALRQPLVLAARSASLPIADVSVARGNIVLADHGHHVSEMLEAQPATGRYRPRLRQTRLTYGAPYDEATARTQPATTALDQNLRSALPLVTLQEPDPYHTKASESSSAAVSMAMLATPRWRPRRDLLTSDRFARVFVVETESDGSATLRFGEGGHGRRPPTGVSLIAHYRVGIGAQGNVGRGAIGHIVTTIVGIVSVRNPLAAQGGTEPESIEQVRLAAPYAFHSQERCITADDYAAVATRHPEVARAAAELRWTGSWYTAFVTVARRDGRLLDDRFKAELLTFMQRFRPAGHDIEIHTPRFAALDILLPVLVRSDVFRSVVRQSLREIFAAASPSGFFYPGRFGFGQPVYLSQVVAAAMSAPGIMQVHLNDASMRFQRWGRPPQGELRLGRIAPGALETVRLDNDPAAPQQGTIEFVLEGGR